MVKHELINKLKSLDCNTLEYCSAIETMFTPAIIGITNESDANFDSELGKPAYPRLQCLELLYFGEIRDVDDIEEICDLAKTDDVFKVLAPESPPSVSTLKNFDDETFLKVELASLLPLIDYHFLEYTGDNYIGWY